MFEKIDRFLFSSPLRSKFSLFFILLVSLPVLFLGGNALYLIDMAHRRDVSSLELRLIDQKIEEADKFISDTLGVIELRVNFTQKSDIDLSGQKFILDGILAANSVFREVRFINLKGMETRKEARTGNTPPLQDVSNLLEFRTALAGRNYLSETFETESGPGMTISAPVFNAKSEMIQILSADIDLRPLLGSIDSARLGSSGRLIATDSRGRLLNMKPAGALRTGENISEYERVRAVLEGTVLDALGPRDRYEGYLSGMPSVGAGKKIPVLGWAILAEWPLSDADEVLHEVRNQVLWLTFAFILGVLLLAPLFAARFTRPIHELQAGAKEIEKGNFKKKVFITTKDELEELGETFNQMAVGLERLQELRNEFVYIVTHELRSPITIIRGYLSMIKEGTAGTVPDSLKEMIGIISQSSDNLAELINDLLEVARFEAGQIKMESTKEDIRSLVVEILSGMKVLGDERKISLEQTGEDRPIMVLADKQRLKQVLTNFISNAVKYNRDGGAVKVSYEARDKLLYVSVSDSGIGMSEEDQKHLFEKFFRAKTVKEIRGTGLGLFITREFIKAMGGDMISVKSKEGEGTTFTFSVPLA